jgi:hypothetical protein
MFGQNQNWNNRRESYIKPPDPDQAQRKASLFQQMKEAITKNKKTAKGEETSEKLTLSEIAQQKHFDLDSSIAEEAQKRIQITQPRIKGKFNPIVINLPKEEVKEEETSTETTKVVTEPIETKTQTQVFVPPDPTNPEVKDLLAALKLVLQYFDKANTELTLLQDNGCQADQETSDLLHSIELTEFNDCEKAELIDKLQEVRRRRRTYKWRTEYFVELDTFVKGNAKFINDLKALKGRLNRIKEKHDNALYRPRVRTDLKPNDKIQPV